MAYTFEDRSEIGVPDYAIMLAAGFGKRMLPLTEDKPKPLLPLGHQTIIDYTLDKFEEAGIRNILVNTHYKAEQMALHLEKRGRPVRICYEEKILETGGGIKAALPWLGGKRFFVANADSVWMDGSVPALERVAALWDDSTMDALLLLAETPEGEVGDYTMSYLDGALSYRRESENAPYIYAGLALLHSRLFRNAPDGPFKLPVLFHEAERNRRLFGIAHKGRWFHLGTPEALARADAEFRAEQI